MSSGITVTPSIRKLDQTVVNRIAAGEVVQRPSAAIKEMLENCLDAGSTSITVTIKGGGLQLLQIQDNGHGIRKDDLAIVCERFTTSKLTSFEDLKTITTFGFRGEALASITHVAHVTITTRTADSPCAYRAKYLDGQLTSVKPGDKVDPKPCAGTVGTTITVEDLFYNMQTRRQAFKNSNEQYQRILDVVTKYSVHFGEQNVSFTCKKQGQLTSDIHTPAKSSSLENIKIAYGASVSRELIDFSLALGECYDNDKLDCDKKDVSVANEITRREDESFSAAAGSQGSLVFSIKGWISNANFSSKRGICILFINNRLVDCQSIKKVVEAVYSEILPRHTHPFIYLSIRMPPQRVDVNVHPTKKEVHFMFEEELLDRIYQGVFKRLRAANESRTFYTQSVLVGHNARSNDIFELVEGGSAVGNDSAGGGDASKKRKNRDDNSSDVANSSQGVDFGRGLYTDVMIGENNRNSVNGSALADGRNIFNNGEDHQDMAECDTESAFASRDGVEERDTGLRNHKQDATKSQGATNGKSQRQDLPPPLLNASSSSSAPIKQGNKLVRTDPGLARIDAFFLPSVDMMPLQSHISGPVSDLTAYCGVCSTPILTKSRKTVKYGKDLTKSVDNSSQQKEDAVDGADEEVLLVETISGCECCVNDVDVSGKRIDRSELIKSRMAHLLNSKEDKHGDRDTTSTGRVKMKKFTETKCLYASVQSLLLEIRNGRHEGLENILKRNSYVGVIDSTYCSVQFGTKLLLLDYSVLSFHLFYQLSIRRFAECTRIILGTAVDVMEYVMTALESPSGGWREEHGPKVRTAECVVKILKQNADMLNEYFKIGVNEDGYLCTIPDLLPGYLPSPLGLPMFLLRLVTETDWEDEISCFRSIATELGRFYSTLSPQTDTDMDYSKIERSADSGGVRTHADGTAKRDADPDTLPSLLMSAIRVHLVAPKTCAEDSTTIVQIAALEQLYKVFERC